MASRDGSLIGGISLGGILVIAGIVALVIAACWGSVMFPTRLPYRIWPRVTPLHTANKARIVAIFLFVIPPPCGEIDY